MALKPCRECKKEVSTEAKACPHCGVKDPTAKKGFSKFTWWLIGTFVFVVTCTGMLGRSKKDPTIDSQAPAIAPQVASSTTQQLDEERKQELPRNSPTELRLTTNESKVFRTLVEFKLNDFSRTGKSPTTLTNLANHLTESADSIQRAYEKNEVGADQRYAGKILHVRATVDSINKDILGKTFLTLIGGTNMFMRPQAKMDGGFDDWLGQLSKGNIVELTCEVSGMVVGSAVLDDCVPSNIWAFRLAGDIAQDVTNLVRSGSEEALRVAAAAIGVASIMPADSKCWTDINACEPEVKKAQKQAKGKPDVKATIQSRLPALPADVLSALFK